MDNLWIWLVVGFNPSEKYESVGMIISNVWKNKKKIQTTNQMAWLDLRENRRTGNQADFPMKIRFSCNCSLKPINWDEKSHEKPPKYDNEHMLRCVYIHIYYNIIYIIYIYICMSCVLYVYYMCVCVVHRNIYTHRNHSKGICITCVCVCWYTYMTCHIHMYTMTNHYMSNNYIFHLHIIGISCVSIHIYIYIHIKDEHVCMKTNTFHRELTEQ